MSAQRQFYYILIMMSILYTVIIFGIQFTTPKIPERVRNLDVLLIQTPPKKEKVKQADFISQANQQGDGENQQSVRPATSNQQQTSAQLNQKAFMQKTSAGPPIPMVIKQPNQKQSPAQREMLRLANKINLKQQQYAQKLRHKAINASTQESIYAEYLDVWRKKVEKTGNRYYPQIALTQKITGRVLLHVAIQFDGNIKFIKIIQSSGHSILDQAAIHIIKKSVPFLPFSEKLRQQIDILDIYRTLIFKQDQQMKTN